MTESTSTASPVTAEAVSQDARGFRIAYNDQTRRSPLMRCTDAELLDLLHTARLKRRNAEAEGGRDSFEHGVARASITLVLEVLADRGISATATPEALMDGLWVLIPSGGIHPAYGPYDSYEAACAEAIRLGLVATHRPVRLVLG